jgi:outer membrane protein assembly factor BamD
VSAIDHGNALLVYFPNSELAPRARDEITELTSRLAEKEFLTGDYYFRFKNYHSANLSYDRVVEQFPTTMWAPRALLRLHESYEALRYDTEAAAARERLLRDYPNSPEAKQLGGSAARP